MRLRVSYDPIIAKLLIEQRHWLPGKLLVRQFQDWQITFSAFSIGIGPVNVQSVRIELSRRLTTEDFNELALMVGRSAAAKILVLTVDADHRRQCLSQRPVFGWLSLTESSIVRSSLIYLFHLRSE